MVLRVVAWAMLGSCLVFLGILYLRYMYIKLLFAFLLLIYLLVRGMGVRGSLSQGFKRVKKTYFSSCIPCTAKLTAFSKCIGKNTGRKHSKFCCFFYYIDSSLNHHILCNFHKSHSSQREVWNPPSELQEFLRA